jgi:hypothetical protein
MQSTLTPTETDPHDIFVIEPDVVLAARADHTPAAPAVEPISHPAPVQAERSPDVAVSVPTVDTTFRATASTAAPVASEIRTPEIAVPSDIHLSGRPPRSRWMARAILGFVFAIGTAAATAAWDHYGDTAKTMIANWTPFVLTPSPSQVVAKPAVAEQSTPADTQGSAQASATDQAAAPSTPAAQPVADTAPVTVAAAASPPPPSAPDIAAMSRQIEALKASIEQLKAGQEQLSQQMAQQSAKETAKTNAARKLSAQAQAAQPVPPPAHKPRPTFSPAMAAAALASSRPTAPAAPPPQAAYRPLPQPAAVPPPPYQPRAQIVDQADVDADAVVVRPPMPLR